MKIHIRYLQKPEFQPYIDCPHICATRSMEIGVKQRMQLQIGINRQEKLLICSIQAGIYPENPVYPVYSAFRYIKELGGAAHPKVIRSFKRNKLNLLTTMRNLTEIGLTPNDVRPNITKVEEELFCELWEAMQPHFEVIYGEAAEKSKT